MQIEVKLNGKNNTLYLRIQDMPLFFEIYQDQVYFKDYELEMEDWIIDLGANIGLTTLFFKNYIAEFLPTISVEPSKKNLILLKKNLNIYREVNVLESVVSNSDGQVPFEDSGLGYNSKIASVETASYNVPSIKMNTLISKYQIKSIGLIKIDVEGAEVELLADDVEWLRIAKNIVIEIHDKSFVAVLVKLMKNQGLELAGQKESVFRFYRIY